VGKRVRGTSLYHSSQCCIVLKVINDAHNYGINCIVVCFMTHVCGRKLWKQYQCELSGVALIETGLTSLTWTMKPSNQH